MRCSQRIVHWCVETAVRGTILAALLGVAGVNSAYPESFDGPTSFVDLPGFRPEEIATSVVVAKSVGTTDLSAVKLLLLNPDAPMKGVLECFEVVKDPDTQERRIEAITKTKQRKPLAKLSLQDDSLTFQWLPGVTRADGGMLRNCVLSVSGSTEQAVGLRSPLSRPALLLDMSKEIHRLPLVDDLPDETHLTLEVLGIEGAEVSGERSAQSVQLKNALFVGIKRADTDVPGARLRVILWKTSLKPEVIVRPELVPALTPSLATTSTLPPGVPQSATPRPAVTKNAADSDDPTKPNSVNLPYTIRSLAGAKTLIGNQLTAARNQILIDQRLIVAKQNELNKFSGTIVGTPQEIDLIIKRIERLRNEIRLLNEEVLNLDQKVVPNLQRQLTAFEPLEKLGNSLHNKAALGLRVYYTVAGKPVPVLVVNGSVAETK